MLTPEQLLLRKTGIGGSDAAAIVGLGKYSTPLSVYLVVCVSEAAIAKIQSFSETKQKAKEWQAREEAEKADILKLFGDSSFLVDENQNPLATWKNKSTTRFDKASFSKVHPSLCDTFIKTSTTRELRLI